MLASVAVGGSGGGSSGGTVKPEISRLEGGTGGGGGGWSRWRLRDGSP